MNIANIPIESKCRWNSLLHFITDFCNTMAIDVYLRFWCGAFIIDSTTQAHVIRASNDKATMHLLLSYHIRLSYLSVVWYRPIFHIPDDDFSHRFLCDDNLTKIHTNSRLRTIIKAKNWRGLYRSPFHMVRQLSQCLRAWCTVYIFNVPPLILRTDVKIGYKQKMKKEWKKQTTTHIETKTVKQNAQNNYIQRIELTL